MKHAILKQAIAQFEFTNRKLWKYLLERHDDGEEREKNHRQQTIAENADNAGDRHTDQAHQVEQSVHRQTSYDSNTIDVSEMDFT